MDINNINVLEWDSDFFGYKIGEISAEDCNHNMNFSSFDLIYIKGNTQTDILIEGFEPSFSETKIVYAKNIVVNDQFEFENIYPIRELNLTKNKIYNLAFESGKHSRFLLDPKFGIEKFKMLYQKWIDNSVDQIVADDIFVYFDNDNDNVLGFVTYKINTDFAQVGLIAVDNLSQGKGIGTKLLNYLENVLFNKNINKVLIPTQLSNKKACFFYEKQGYSIYEQIKITHFWKI